jgi:hypothetical protein
VVRLRRTTTSGVENSLITTFWTAPKKVISQFGIYLE